MVFRFLFLHTYPTSCAYAHISSINSRSLWLILLMHNCPMMLSTRWSELRVGRISLADHFAGGRMLQEPHWRDRDVGRRRPKILEKSGNIPARWALRHSPRAIQRRKVPAIQEKKWTRKRKNSIYLTVEAFFLVFPAFTTCSSELSPTKTDPLSIAWR